MLQMQKARPIGQELNPETYAIAKADMLIKGGNASGMKYGDTLDNDQFIGYEFDYIISNPPFGIDWKSEEETVKKEHKLGFAGRFGPGLPNVGDGQLLFLLNGVKKLKENGRMTIIQNGSPLFSGDAGSGPSEIRKYLIENDLLEAIIQLPTDLFYNTGISTYIWLITKNKADNRRGYVQLIDASNCYIKRRKNIGSKRVDLNNECIDLIIEAYTSFENEKFIKDNLIVESKVFENEYFGFTKLTIETAMRDEKGNLILKKGVKQPVKGETDYECISLVDNLEEFIKENYTSINPNVFVDRKKDKIGYAIPFTRLFYEYKEPEKTEAILERIKKLTLKENKLISDCRKFP